MKSFMIWMTVESANWMPATSSKATTSQCPTRPMRPVPMWAKSWATVVLPPEIRMEFGEVSR
jgi:hypothetical protein